MSDIKDGKLAPVAVTRIKRRGGKVQTCVNLSLEGAEALHKVLGDALKDARAKQRKKHISAFAANLMLLVLQTKRQ
jgi:hypothetical protein